MADYKIDFAALPWHERVGARSKTVVLGRRRLRLAEFTQAFEDPEWCAKAHIGYVLEGEVEIDFSGKVDSFKAGDGIFIPGGEGSKHRLKVVSPKALLILVEEA
ncbi:MAG: cupin domain-containing protein [Terriglobia bacterium]